MIIVNGQIANIIITPADPEGTPAIPHEIASVKIEGTLPEVNGTVTLSVPSTAIGGLAMGPCRIFIESA